MFLVWSSQEIGSKLAVHASQSHLSRADAFAVAMGSTTFTFHRGYIPQGADVANATMTLEQAKLKCASLPDCAGITFAGKLERLKKVGTERFTATMWLKGTDEWVANDDHVSLVKKQAACSSLSFKRYNSNTGGPYCCMGKGCPSINGYKDLAVECRLPAKVLEQGLPACAHLRGKSVRNIAPDAVAVASSQYAHAENSGAAAANDGVINNHIFHSACENGPQYWRINWQGPMVLLQVALHNRKEFKARMFDSTLILRGRSNNVLRNVSLHASRSMYVWTARPLVHDVWSLEVHMPHQNGCLHFKEVEAFGGRQEDVQEMMAAFRELPEPPYPPPPPPPAKNDAARIMRQQQEEHEQQQQQRMAQNQQSAAALAQQQKQAKQQAQQAHAQAQQQAKAGKASNARTPSAAAAQAAEEAMLRQSADSDLDAIWAAAASSLATCALLFVHWMWIKTRWLDVWR